ncbi:secreted immunoglobulin domain 1 [Halichoeres trimaculatus]|uniref:secreted immunoglobulin domain 1 n=1 Tax=Halichoeres trimaculatus TaxID=147232 RepID=UPI003D9F55EC
MDLVCVILLSLCGVCTEQDVSAPPASTLHVTVGENVTLRCPLLDPANVTNGSFDHLRVSWYRQAAGQSPEMLLSFSPTNGSEPKYGAGVGPDKVSAGSDGSLRLHGSRHSDAAFYYCGLSQGAEKERLTETWSELGSGLDRAGSV